MSSSIATTKEIGQNIGNNHNLADTSFDSIFYYLKVIYHALYGMNNHVLI